MKYFTALLTIALIVFSVIPANAQRGMKHQGQGRMMSPDSSRGMMGGQGMMRGMMGRGMMDEQPMMKVMMMVNVLPDMQEPLSLTEDQANKLIDMRADFQKKQIDYKAGLRKKRNNLEKMMKQDAAAEKIRERLKDCSDIRIDMYVAAYKTAKKMKSVLNDEQKENLKAMVRQRYGMMEWK